MRVPVGGLWALASEVFPPGIFTALDRASGRLAGCARVGGWCGVLRSCSGCVVRAEIFLRAGVSACRGSAGRVVRVLVSGGRVLCVHSRARKSGLCAPRNARGAFRGEREGLGALESSGGVRVGRAGDVASWPMCVREKSPTVGHL